MFNFLPGKWNCVHIEHRAGLGEEEETGEWLDHKLENPVLCKRSNTHKVVEETKKSSAFSQFSLFVSLCSV